ncbi:hypothetical protein m02_08290 [Bartonella bovis m02]|uniref:Phage protein n=1 Tax=Bartonella bovis m02 TaxID=1094492 RepID=N6VRV9_9HYPH|nr:hypothetical protein m02_08290 [Bartonella bovis m02]
MTALEACNRLQRLFSVKASDEQIKKAGFFLSSLRVPANTDPNAVASSYKLTLKQVSAYALAKAVENILTGQVEGMSKVFMPTCAELVSYCQKIESKVLARAWYVHRAIENTQVKALKKQERGENVIPFTKTG